MMNNRKNIFLATAIASLAICGCTAYPTHRAYYSSGYGSPTYITTETDVGTTYVAPAAVGTSTIYVEKPYFTDVYHYGDYYYEPHGHRHHRHGRGSQHGYGMGPMMPPRGASPARHGGDRHGNGHYDAVAVKQAANAQKAIIRQAATAQKTTVRQAVMAQRATVRQAAIAQKTAASQRTAAAQRAAAEQRAAAARFRRR